MLSASAGGTEFQLAGFVCQSREFRQVLSGLGSPVANLVDSVVGVDDRLPPGPVWRPSFLHAFELHIGSTSAVIRRWYDGGRTVLPGHAACQAVLSACIMC